MKKVFILVCTLLLVGCSADYTLTIDKNYYTESLNLSASNNTEKENFSSIDWIVPIDYDKYIETSDSDNYHMSKDSIIYEHKMENNVVNLYYEFDTSGITNSTMINSCFDTPRFIYLNGEYIITTKKGCKCFNNRDLNELTINIIVNDKKVTKNNDDQIIDNKYIWKIDRSNYNNVSINLSYENIEETNYESSSSKIEKVNNSKFSLFSSKYINLDLWVFCIIFLIIGGIGVYVFNKIKKDDD